MFFIQLGKEIGDWEIRYPGLHFSGCLRAAMNRHTGRTGRDGFACGRPEHGCQGMDGFAPHARGHAVCASRRDWISPTLKGHSEPSGAWEGIEM
jgi:hypothetical protein